MVAQKRPFQDTSRWIAILFACAALAACATPQPRYSTGLGANPAEGPRRAQAEPPASSSSSPGKGYKLGKPYQVGGIWYVPKQDPRYDVKGVASWYGDQFHNRSTANGEVFDKYGLTAAHTTLPLPSIVEVTNLENGRKLKVRVNDRGPFVGGRVIDLSYAAAKELGFERKGLAKVRVRYVGLAPLTPPRHAERGYDDRDAAPVLAPPPIVQARADIPQAQRDETSTDVDWPTAVAPYPVESAQDAARDAVEVRPRPVRRDGPPPINPPDEAIVPETAFGSAPVQQFRIQAGAFSDESNARKIAAALSQAGALASIEPIERNGARLFRVTATAGGDEARIMAIRDRLAGYGVYDARVSGPF